MDGQEFRDRLDAVLVFPDMAVSGAKFSRHLTDRYLRFKAGFLKHGPHVVVGEIRVD